MPVRYFLQFTYTKNPNMTTKQILIGAAVVAAVGVGYYYWKKKQTEAQPAPATVPAGAGPASGNGAGDDVAGIVKTAGDALHQLGDLFGS